MIIGFSWGGWVTGGTSRTAAVTAGDVARGELASAICVEQIQCGAGRSDTPHRTESDLRQLQEASVRRSRRLGDHARADGSGPAGRAELRHCALRIEYRQIWRFGSAGAHLCSDPKRGKSRSVITFKPNADVRPKPAVDESNRFEQVRLKASNQRKKPQNEVASDSVGDGPDLRFSSAEPGESGGK